MKDKAFQYLIFALIALIVLAIIALAVWEVIAQINYDGQYIEWRWIPLW